MNEQPKRLSANSYTTYELMHAINLRNSTTTKPFYFEEDYRNTLTIAICWRLSGARTS